MNPRNWMIAGGGMLAMCLACGTAWWLGSSSAVASSAPRPSLASVARPQALGVDTLTFEQKTALLGEAETAYSQGQQLKSSDPAAAQSAFEKAASKYQLLVDHGAHNSRLYFNLANAELQSGHVPAAIANYLRAESLAPGDRQIATNLEHARALAGIAPVAPAQSWSHELLRYVGSYHQLLIAITACAWIVGWCALIAARFYRQLPWRFVVAPAAVLVALCGGSLAFEASQRDSAPHGVVTAQQVIVREAGGEAFAPRFEQPLRAGTEFAVVDHRADWLEIRLGDGRSGWIPSAEAQVVSRSAH